MRTHYTPTPKRNPIADIAFAVALGLTLAMLALHGLDALFV